MMLATVPIAVPILLYHSVCDRPAAGQEAFTVTPAVFREHVRAISDAGRTALTVSELASALRGERALPSRPVLMTFDDGFADVRPAVELLLDAGLAATVFVTSGLVGREAMLTAAGIRELAALGERVEIGAHSVTHSRLDELSATQAATEISASKAALESVVETPLESFAYPHGAYNGRARAAVIDAGFSAAAAVKNALSHTEDDPYALARVTVLAPMSVRHIEMLLTGSGAPLAWRRERLRTRGYRSVRRLRRRLRRTVA
jgi:peptidoglycan/xylan/chitin deacetylase (PgdA/CDA1 family)